MLWHVDQLIVNDRGITNYKTAYFPYFDKKKMKVGLCDHYAVCLCILPYQLFMPEPIFMKLVWIS
jgi:hypothetical protein